MNLRFFKAFEDSSIEIKKATYTRLFKRLAHSTVISTLLGFASQSFADTCSESCSKHQESVTLMCELLKGKVTPWVIPLAMPTQNGIVICDCPCGIMDYTPSGQLPVEHIDGGDDLNLSLRNSVPGKVEYENIDEK